MKFMRPDCPPEWRILTTERDNNGRNQRKMLRGNALIAAFAGLKTAGERPKTPGESDNCPGETANCAGELGKSPGESAKTSGEMDNCPEEGDNWTGESENCPGDHVRCAGEPVKIAGEMTATSGERPVSRRVCPVNWRKLAGGDRRVSICCGLLPERRAVGF